MLLVIYLHHGEREATKKVFILSFLKYFYFLLIIKHLRIKYFFIIDI